MRLKAILATALIVAQLAVIAPATRAAFPAESQTPPGQVSVLTVNARQGLILDRKRFEQLFELVRALRGRPEAFDGGNRGAALVPDVIAFQEIRLSNLEILKRLMNQRFKGGGFEIAGRTDMDVKFIINTQTVALAGQERTWQDHCLNHKFPDGDPRTFQLLPLVEVSTGARFTVASVYWSATYARGTHDCRRRNAEEIRRQLATDVGPAFVVGDFNTRAVDTLRECDPDERSAPRDWWVTMTQPTAGGRAFTDAVKAHSKGMASEWTHEQKTPRVLCNGTRQSKRSRIDYIFSDGAVVGEAHADLVAWAGEEPGTKHYSPGWYSDHRIVWARFVIAGPPRPETPSATPGKGGVIQLQWAPVEGAAGWILYRATGANPYRPLTRLDSTATTFDDRRTSHGRRYRYAIAALGAEGSQGLESRGRFGRADARGPTVRAVDPPRGATGVARRIKIRVFIDEPTPVESVTADSIRMFKSGRRVAGRVVRDSARRLILRPARPLHKGKTYRVVVRGISDALGNIGPRFEWRFKTVAPAKKKRRR